MGGDALASVLLGDVSPSGRLTTTIYPADFIHQRNITDMVMRPHGDHIPGITYRFLEQPPLFEFGFGKSYTSFAFASAGVSEQHVQTQDVQAAFAPYFASRGGAPSSHGGALTFAASVKNTGKATSDVVVLCFVSPTTNKDGPRRQLAGFERVARLAPGMQETVHIGLAPTALTTVSKDGTERIVAGEWAVQCGGAPDGFAEGKLTIVGEDVETFALPAAGS
jgi:beta-D-xylosidase 4